MKNLSRIMLHTGIDIYAVQCIRDNIHTRAEVARLAMTADLKLSSAHLYAIQV